MSFYLCLSGTDWPLLEMNDNDRRDIAVIGSMKFLSPSVVIPKNGKLIDWIIVYGLVPQL